MLMTCSDILKDNKLQISYNMVHYGIQHSPELKTMNYIRKT